MSWKKFSHFLPTKFSSLLTFCRPIFKKRWRRKKIRLLTFSEWNEHSKSLFDQLQINTVTQQVFLLNTCLVHQVLNEQIPIVVKVILDFKHIQNQYHTRGNALSLLSIPKSMTTAYAIKSIRNQCVKNWNFLKFNFPTINLNYYSMVALPRLAIGSVSVAINFVN